MAKDKLEEESHDGEEEGVFERGALDTASFVVPLGVQLASNGSLVFDQPEDELCEDINTMLRTFVELGPDKYDGSIHNPSDQRKMLTDITKLILTQMGTPDGGLAHDLDAMLASTFDRFSQLVDFRELAVGCGDRVADPLHTDRKLADELAANHGRISE